MNDKLNLFRIGIMTFILLVIIVLFIGVSNAENDLNNKAAADLRA